MLSEADYEEEVRCYKNMKLDGHERQRCHALILVRQEYSYREIALTLLVDERTVRRWAEQYEQNGLTGLQNHRQCGGAHEQSELQPERSAQGVCPLGLELPTRTQAVRSTHARKAGTLRKLG
jgi:transposase